MDYKLIVKSFFIEKDNCKIDNFYLNLSKLVKVLKNEGLDRSNINQEIVDEITIGFLTDKASDLFKIKFGYYVIHYLNTLIDLDFSDNAVLNKEPASVEELKPEDFKPKEYDSSLLSIIGLEEVDK
ncbi:MAG TPA: hypothetical protein VI911_11535 [Patescibacteria group bacterium]|nr:hypothetical protein [Patescibacteria group bacterium]